MKRKLFKLLKDNGWTIKKSGNMHKCCKGEHIHWIVLHESNKGADILGDWSYYSDDRDGFNVLLNSFIA